MRNDTMLMQKLYYAVKVLKKRDVGLTKIGGFVRAAIFCCAITGVPKAEKNMKKRLWVF